MTSPLRAALRLLLVTSLGIGSAWVPVRADDGATAPDQAMRMFRDPETGAVGRPSAAALRAEAAQAPRPAPAAPVVEEAVPGPGGGVKVNLRGAFRAAVVRQAGPPGAVVHECVEEAGQPHE